MSRLDVLNWLIQRSLYLKPTSTWRDVARAIQEAKGDGDRAAAALIRGGASGRA